MTARISIRDEPSISLPPREETGRITTTRFGRRFGYDLVLVTRLERVSCSRHYRTPVGGRLGQTIVLSVLWIARSDDGDAEEVSAMDYRCLGTPKRLLRRDYGLRRSLVIWSAGSDFTLARAADRKSQVVSFRDATVTTKAGSQLTKAFRVAKDYRLRCPSFQRQLGTPHKVAQNAPTLYFLRMPTHRTSRTLRELHWTSLSVQKIESIYSISNCTVACQVKFATTLKKMMTDKYCPRGEIKKLEFEMWNLKVKGNDVVTYSQRFQELALMCDRMFLKEIDQVEKYVGGLPDIDPWPV
ncbi:putative reverse transcriptase domain-containing protein [Tanacetum coccineum]